MDDDEQQRRREWFRRLWEHKVAFNVHHRINVRRWDPDGVELVLPYADHLCANPGVFHGGIISALIDTSGSAAVVAGHDFTKGSRLATLSLAVQYLSTAPGEDAVAFGRCTRRGRLVHFADVLVRSTTSGKALAQGLVTVQIAGEVRGLERPLES